MANKDKPVLTNKNWVGDGKKHSVYSKGKGKLFTSLPRAKAFAKSEARKIGVDEYIYKTSSGNIKGISVKNQKRKKRSK